MSTECIGATIIARAHMPQPHTHSHTHEHFHKAEYGSTKRRRCNFAEEDCLYGMIHDSYDMQHDMCTTSRHTMVNSKQFSHVIGSSAIIVALLWLMKSWESYAIVVIVAVASDKNASWKEMSRGHNKTNKLSRFSYDSCDALHRRRRRRFPTKLDLFSNELFYRVAVAEYGL